MSVQNVLIWIVFQIWAKAVDKQFNIAIAVLLDACVLADITLITSLELFLKRNFRKFFPENIIQLFSQADSS